MLRKLLITACAFLIPANAVTAAPFSIADGRDDAIRGITRGITPELIEIRRSLHAHPELGMREFKTAALVADYFRKLGLEVRSDIAGTGVMGVLKGGKPGPIVMMRGDMDALPITEETGLPFASHEKVEYDGRSCGLMHACGHDIHTTLLLGTAHVLSRLRDDLPGTVLFIAQPAEETGQGARAMIEDGVFRDLIPEAAFAFHVNGAFKTGTIRATPGWSSANADAFRLVIKSKGGHGARPEECVDPIAVGARIVLDLQIMIAREIAVHDDTVITVGSFHAGSAGNVIPGQAELKATVRTYGEAQRRTVKEKVTRLITNICEASGAEFDLNYGFGLPALYNNPDLLRSIRPTMERVLGGPDKLVTTPPSMGSEDFSWFAEKFPAVMIGLGIVPADLDRTSVHSPTFVADEDAIPVGVNLMSAVIWDYLAAKTGSSASTAPAPQGKAEK